MPVHQTRLARAVIVGYLALKDLRANLDWDQWHNTAWLLRFIVATGEEKHRQEQWKEASVKAQGSWTPRDSDLSDA
jgi:hypothetical protein